MNGISAITEDETNDHPNSFHVFVRIDTKCPMFVELTTTHHGTHLD